MTAFSLAFLVPLLVVRLTGSGGGGAVALAAVAGLALLFVKRHRNSGSAALAGALLFLVRNATAPDGDDRRFPPAPDPAPVTVEGTVDGPCRPTESGCLIPLRGAPPLFSCLPVPGPLPGTRIRAQGRLDAGGGGVSVLSREALEVLDPPPFWHPGALAERARRSIRDRIETGLSQETSSHLKTLLLGDRGLSASERDRLARTGTLHLFAVSGMHLVIVLGMLRTLTGPKPRLLLAGLFAYAALAGFASPVGRALLVSAGTLLARVLGRSARPGRHLLLALVLVLAWDPSSLDQAGFLLSFAAYAGIVLIAVPVLARRRRDALARLLEKQPGSRLSGWLLPPVVVSLAAFAASVAPTAWIFHRISPAAVPGTLLLSPVVNALLVLSFLLALFPGWPPFAFLADAGVRLLLRGTEILDGIPGASVDVARPAPVAVAFYVAALVWLAWRAARARPLLPPMLAALAALPGLALPAAAPPGFELLDAGRGSALLAVLPEGPVLIDAGPPESRVADQVFARGVSRLDHVCVTHDHLDHAGGLPAVRGRLRPRSVFGFPPADGIAPLFRGDRPSPSIETLWPPKTPIRLGSNDSSLVLFIRSGARSLLVTGDLETRGLRKLIEAGPLPMADVVVVPHHGARNDALPDLLLQAQPDEVWIPARAGFPDEGTMSILLWSGCRIRGTWTSSR